MATRILDLAVASATFLIGTNEDWLDGLGAWCDQAGVPIPLDGLVLNFQMRLQGALTFTAPLNASTATTVNGMPVSGRILVAGNQAGLSVPRAVMLRVVPGPYAAELQAAGDGIVRTIGRYTGNVVEGVLL